MNLKHYLDRIEFGGTVEPSFDTLAALQEAHVCSVPFENLDVQLGRPLTTRVDEAYQKIVDSSRGGWCYEQNGLFGWALSEIGFEVTRISADVMRGKRGADSAASHLCLLVTFAELKKKYLVDVGFGGSMIRPIELAEDQYVQPPFKLGLERLKDGYWRFWEDIGDGKFYFDFIAEPAHEASLTKKCAFLQSNPGSNFVLNLVAQRRSRDRHCTLRGRVLTVTTAAARKSITLASSQALVDTLVNEFRLDVPDIASVWPAVAARHEALFGTDTAG